jgi:alpha-L-fucosidase
VPSERQLRWHELELYGFLHFTVNTGWFYHPAEDDQVKSPRELLDLYYASVGRGASLLLNVPPDRRGRIHESDERSLRGFGELLQATFGADLARGASATASNARGGDPRFSARNVVDGRRDSYWATDDGVTTPELVLDLGRVVRFDVVSLREHLPLGQRVEDWALDAWTDGAWREFAKGRAIGNRRLWRGEVVTTGRLRLRITGAPVGPALSEVALYLEPEAARH